MSFYRVLKAHLSKYIVCSSVLPLECWCVPSSPTSSRTSQVLQAFEMLPCSHIQKGQLTVYEKKLTKNMCHHLSSCKIGYSTNTCARQNKKEKSVSTVTGCKCSSQTCNPLLLICRFLFFIAPSISFGCSSNFA
jgi:hypothetical protein